MNIDRVSYVRRRLAESQLTEFPKYAHCLGLDMEVHKDVFWDDDNNVTGRWVTENVPPTVGKRVLEVGCGCGLTALFLAKNGASQVLATDFNPNAITNTLANARRNGITNITSIQSDLYKSVDQNSRFDHIVFHLPSTRVPENFEFSSMIEYSSFDPGGSLLHRFLQESGKYLTPTGTMILGYNVSRNESAVTDKLETLSLPHKLIARKKITSDGMINLHLYEIWPLPGE
ncbi:MAG: methyltransferase domain-containing protein [Mesorhizobium sp.]|uniref:methyltransferase n=1 Tax=Mesorhizobium sp. TaxID=1871066 RepID=UPI000FE4F0DC|nr:methyltransferase [Mesorhizobium sp.]RWB20811.1 MAG: methyltransferase domain-containing protein [Mesorhizobium sp.]RWC37575.1 MAG: methyltransferase domain-containing protein [Mesorhizobium sp.]